MKTIDEYMATPYRMVFHPDAAEGGFSVSFPDLPGCLTCGDTIDKAYENALDAKRAWLEATLEDGGFIQDPTDKSSYSGEFRLRIPRELHRQLAERAAFEGTSMNQYCLYLLSTMFAQQRVAIP